MEWYWIVLIVLVSMLCAGVGVMYLMFLGFVEFWKELFNR